MRKGLGVAAAGVLLGAGMARGDVDLSRQPNFVDQQFYQTTGPAETSPEKLGWPYENVTFPSLDGTELNGWLVHSAQGLESAKGTILYSHGNYGAMGIHLHSIGWLRNAGWNVFLYDYRGYGESAGKPERFGIVSDMRAALKFLQQKEEIDSNNLIAAGFSLGGATTITGMGLEGGEGVRLVVSMSGFSSYQKVVLDTAGPSLGALVSDELAPRDFVADIAPTPLLFIHGAEDRLVKVDHSEEMAKLAKGPVEFIKVDDGDHLNPFGSDAKDVMTDILRKLDAAVAK